MNENKIKNIFKNIMVQGDTVIISLLLAAVIIVPLFFDIRLYSVFDLSKVTALYLLTIAILFVWSIMFALNSHLTCSHTSIDIPILAYIGVFIISSILSINPIMSLFGTYKRFEGLTATVCYIFLFYTTVNFVTTKKRFYFLLISIITGAAISSCYGIAQHIGFDMFKWSSFEARRVFSTFGNPVFFSTYLVMALPLAVVLFLGNSFERKESPPVRSPYIVWFFFALSLIIYTTFWLTNTRACFVALLGGLIPLFFFVSKWRLTKRYKNVILIVLYILIGVAFNVRHETSVIKHFTADVKAADSPESSVSKGESKELPDFDNTQNKSRPWITAHLSVAGSSFSRIFQYLAALEIMKDYPVFGIGPDTIGIIYQKNLAKVFSLRESDRGFPFPRQDRIHNDILDTVVTRGIFGLGTYLWLLAAFGIYIGKNYKKLTSENKLLMLGLLTGVLCYLIQNEFSFGNTPIVMLFWIMMGLCISIIKMQEREEWVITGKFRKDAKLQSPGNGKNQYIQTPAFTISRISNFSRWLCCGIVLTVLGFILIFVIRVYRADAYFEYGRRVFGFEDENAHGKVEKGLYLMKHAIHLNPYETFYRDELCRVYIQMAFKTKNEVWIQGTYDEANNSLQLIPEHFLSFFQLGVIYQMLAENFKRDTIDDAITCYKKAIEMDAFQAPFHSNLASLYAGKGDFDSAIEELYQAYLIRPYELPYVERLSNIFLQKGDWERASIFTMRAIELNPAEPGNHNKLGVILNKKQMYEEAVIEFKKAVEINPKEPMYTHNLASTLVTQGKDADAEQIIQMFNEMHPHHRYIRIRLLLANIYLGSNHWEKVISECGQIVKIDDKSAEAYKMLGIAYYRMHQFELAGKMLSHALTLKADDQEIKDLLTAISSNK
ncbi:MAG: tetratricopeptide repeat protein [Candidatus Jettenia sp.]|nr:MAG: hypothetical protein EDM77_07750 [Candidatus Jettenia sp. AMX1]MBC6927510.1 tetratricopeptide repeat protein [Candidatus Jettenia sp.]MCE7879191.1 tetratricopeptide repeat protein [Candidatus Jettenia sp. AMX1]MCQ3925690.1 tetratricopeptide repeat protein [Candidatus Jettenia sp.]MDL1937599.1 hypothetical protein [Candidatus Jettenia sp. AMX1]